MDHFRPLYKLHRRGPVNVWDPRDPGGTWPNFTAHRSPIGIDLAAAYAVYGLEDCAGPEGRTRITIEELPGLAIYPEMLSIDLQKQLVRESTGEYLADPRHKTNFDAHMDLERPIDIFSGTRGSSPLLPAQIQRKLRWVTLGGQYNWTTKVYPSFEVGSDLCPAFPPRLGAFVHAAFKIHADAAIVNYYSQGDILSPHQDVAELAKSDLVSISLGCDSVFYVALHRHDAQPLPILLRSGDVLVMGGESRWAFHGVGRVFEGTCPFEMEAEQGEYIRNKRININIRQMFDR